MTKRECLNILGISSDDEKAVKAAFRHLAKQHHPDKGGDTDTYMRVQEAYDRLRDKKFTDAYQAPNSSSDYSTEDFIRDMKRKVKRIKYTLDVPIPDFYKGVKTTYKLKYRVKDEVSDTKVSITPEHLTSFYITVPEDTRVQMRIDLVAQDYQDDDCIITCSGLDVLMRVKKFDSPYWVSPIKGVIVPKGETEYTIPMGLSNGQTRGSLTIKVV